MKFSYTLLFWFVVIILGAMFLFSSEGPQNSHQNTDVVSNAGVSSSENTRVIESSVAESSFLAPQDTWYTSTIDKASIQKISIQKATSNPMYSSENAAAETWDASEKQDRTIVCKIEGSTLYIYACGVKKIQLNTDASYTFAGFTNVTEISGLELIDTSQTMSMSWMFGDCNNLTAIDIPEEWNSSGVIDMSYMFYNDSMLTSANITELDMESVEDTSYMFGFCKNLTSVNMEDWSILHLLKISTKSQMFMEAGTEAAGLTLLVDTPAVGEWLQGNPKEAVKNTMLIENANIQARNPQ